MGNKANSGEISNTTLLENSLIKSIFEEEKIEDKKVTKKIKKSITEKGKLITNRIYFK